MCISKILPRKKGQKYKADQKSKNESVRTREKDLKGEMKRRRRERETERERENYSNSMILKYLALNRAENYSK